MITPNMHYAELKESYLFFHIAQKTTAYLEAHPDQRLYRMGIGDVTLPLCDAVIKALHEAVEDQAVKERFHGYMPECGDPSLREIIAKHYQDRGVAVSAEEVFVSSGASDELGDILDLMGRRETKELIEKSASEKLYNSKYEYTGGNIARNWIHLLIFVVVFAVLSIITLEFIDKDKR